MNRNRLTVNRNRIIKAAVTLLAIAGIVLAGLLAAIRIRNMLAPKKTTVVKTVTTTEPVINDRKPLSTDTRVKADKKVDNSAIIGGTPYSEVFRQGGHTKGADGKQYIYSLEMNTAHIDLNVNNGYKYLKGTLVLSDYSKARTYLSAQIMIYDIGSNQPFYVSREMTEDDRSDIEILVDLSGHEKIRIEIPYFRDLYLATDGLYFSDSK